MSKVKIISNPYQKLTIFQSWDESQGKWVSINCANNSNSGLLSDDIRIGFFPFRAKHIVDIIATEYATASEKVEVVFEGTDDEYRELEDICNESSYENQVLSLKSSLYLENARDILPKIISIFKELRPLVDISVSDESKIERELDRFSDASNDIIPLCVIGNYSSGKSTFINALIGYELLPSSDEPTTARIFKISRSRHVDRASVDYGYGNESVRLEFDMGPFRVDSSLDENPLTKKLKILQAETSGDAIPVKLNKVLDVINDYANKTKDNNISDLIEIVAPFDDQGLWGKTWSNFVIFDTPGSNSASNAKHYQVLKKAMEDLSNGLPIFVSEYDSLDSTDNDKLYQDINNMDELDNRFTMIIVNKADSASLKKSGYADDDCDRILSLAIPRKLYSGGIYFISSIIGLGSKNDEDFISEHNGEIFEDQKAKYIDPNNKNYKKLYCYNIVPGQIKRKFDRLSERHANRLYANSGLCSVEQAIETFAGVYSHYNKCQQSHLFLGKVIQITSDEISDAKRKREEYRERIHTNLEIEKSALVARLYQYSSELETLFFQEYPEIMRDPYNMANSVFTYESLKEKEEDFRQAEEGIKGIEGYEREVKESWKALGDRLFGNITKAASERNLSSIRNIGTGVKEGFKDISGKSSDRRRAKSEVENAVSDGLISFIRESFSTHVNGAQTLLDNSSKGFWASKAERLKHDLIQIVTNSTALTTEKRSDIADIIIEYQELAFEYRAEVIFDKDTFRRRLFGDSTRLDIERLTKRYNSGIQEHINEFYSTFYRSHARSFNVWMINLLTIIIDNIVEFNPQLHNQAEIIREETERIADLESRMAKLNDDTARVRRMMEWKED